MRLSTLTYPIEQPYRLRWITEIFYAGSTVLILLLIVFNVVLVGYDSVAVMMPDPNITDYEQWWAPKSLPSALKIRTKPGECDEAKLPLNTPLRTNSSLPLFPYELQNNFNQHDLESDPRGLRGETPYKANPLDICQVQSMTLTMEPKILSFVIASTLLCEPIGNPPRARHFKTWFRRADSPRFRPDSILEYMAYMAYMASPNETDSNVYQKISRDGPPKDPYLNVLGVIDALSSDLIRTMWMRKVTWFYVNTTSPQPPVPELGSLAWDAEIDDRAPLDESRLDQSWKTYVDGYWYEGVYVRGISTTIVNVFVALRDAIHLDLGYVAPTNIYTNKTAFNSMIAIDSYRSDRLVPIMHTYFAEDVRTSTFTMYVTLYGIFVWIASTLDRNRKGPQPWERFMNQRYSDPGYGVRIKRPTSRASSYSSMPYTPEFEDDTKRLLEEDLEKRA
ncbi:hypothetical protein FRC07_000012 [Ceratobasidium sp. 392]|nr:hypothetical protein FRC07_000012 [Ceratobasidium sp. 392]